MALPLPGTAHYSFVSMFLIASAALIDQCHFHRSICLSKSNSVIMLQSMQQQKIII
jgi:hypothetical protein